MVKTDKKRGVWLTIWLILMLIFNFITAISYLFFNQMLGFVYPNVSSWMWYLDGIIAIANVVFVIFLFMWKKWPFYGICALTIIVFILNIIAGFGIISSIFGLLGPAILYLFMRFRWKLFD